MSIDKSQIVGTDTQIAVVEVGIPGPMGDITPELKAEREAAEKAAKEAEKAVDDAKDAAKDAWDAAKDSEASAQLAQDFISSVRVADAQPYDPEKQYVFPEMAISPFDGSVYRCIKPSKAEEPSQSLKWVEVAMVISEMFEYDENGDIMPRLKPKATRHWTLDEDGNIVPAE